MPSSIQKFIDNLNSTPCGTKNYAKLFETINITKKEITPYCHWNQERYTRNLILKTNQYELLILCWEAGQCSSIHDHNNQDCWVYVVDGVVKESLFSVEKNNGQFKLTKKQVSVLKQGKKTYIHDSLGVHSLENINNKQSITLHLYVSAVEKCNIYTDGQIKKHEMAYDYQ